MRGLYRTLLAVGGQLAGLRAGLLVAVLAEEGHAAVQQGRRVGGREELGHRHQAHGRALLGARPAAVLLRRSNSPEYPAVVLQQLLGAFGSVLQILRFDVHVRSLQFRHFVLLQRLYSAGSASFSTHTRPAMRPGFSPRFVNPRCEYTLGSS